jgi:hypothetical protein
MVRSKPRWHTLQIDSLHTLSELIAVANQVAKVFPRYFGFCLEFTRFLLLNLELFNISLETNADLICRTLENTADLRADTQGVCVSVVKRG